MINGTAQVYRYADEKSDKFWRIEYAGNTLVVNYGKTGAIGKYQIKECDSDEACEKEAKKFIASKVKKGYELYPDFDADNHLYMDDSEMGIHPMTAHPKFRTHFNDEFYYDCANEEAPFGSDEGSDTLDMLEEYVRKDKSFNFTVSPEEQIEIDWGFETYHPPIDITRETTERLLKVDEMCLTQSDMVTYATAFSQIKIMGRVDAELKEMAINAMKRKVITDELQGYGFSETLAKMIKDLEGFK